MAKNLFLDGQPWFVTTYSLWDSKGCPIGERHKVHRENGEIVADCADADVALLMVCLKDAFKQKSPDDWGGVDA